MRNKYCSYDTLCNEADVEQSFVRRMLEDLGYSNREIRPKSTHDCWPTPRLKLNCHIPEGSRAVF